MLIAGRNKTNRPYFFAGTNGARVEFPAMGEGSGDLDGRDLAGFNEACRAGLIERLPAQEPKRRGRPPSVKDDNGPPV